MKNRLKRVLSVMTEILMIFTIIILSGCGKTTSQNPASSDDAGDYAFEFRTIENQTYIAPAQSFAGGNGTEENPYQISNAAELALLAEMINGEYSAERTAHQQAHYVLTADISLNEALGNADWSKAPPEYAWIPIGIDNPFKGVFDGDNHTISGMYINEDVSDYDDYDASYGLFGENQGSIKNLTLEQSYICVSGYTVNIGSIAGQNALADAKIENCISEAEIYCYDASCGGLVGDNMGGEVSDCIFRGSVNALRAEADASIGGIVGYNDGSILSCRNEGSIITSGSSASLGGITGSHHGGVIDSCENDGLINGGSQAGGIAGGAFLSNVGGAFKSTSWEITGCTNNGAVSTHASVAGGIVGEATNHHSDYTLQIERCKNNGDVQAEKKTGGIVGLITVSGAVSVSGCENTANLYGSTVGGIAASVSYNYGSLTVSDSNNGGDISASLYAAGIIAENNMLGVYLSEKPSLDIAVTGCDNTGGITTDYCGGGILGTIVCPLGKSECEKITLILDNDIHRADIICNSFNAFVGGITGNLGIPYTAVTITGCNAEGLVSFTDIPTDEDTVKTESGRLEYARMSGGIVGRIGTGQYLSTTGDAKREDAVNAPDANIRFIRCESSVRFDAPDESKYTYESDGAPVYLNHFGGIIGYFSGEEGYAFSAKDCTYTNVDRGLGNQELADIGTKA